MIFSGIFTHSLVAPVDDRLSAVFFVCIPTPQPPPPRMLTGCLSRRRNSGSSSNGCRRRSSADKVNFAPRMLSKPRKKGRCVIQSCRFARPAVQATGRRFRIRCALPSVVVGVIVKRRATRQSTGYGASLSAQHLRRQRRGDVWQRLMASRTIL